MTERPSRINIMLSNMVKNVVNTMEKDEEKKQETLARISEAESGFQSTRMWALEDQDAGIYMYVCMYVCVSE